VSRGIRSRAPEQPADAKTREVLARRAERLRRPPAVTTDDPVEWVAEFPLGDERYAITLSVLRAAVPLRRVTPVPLSRPHVVGILRFGGQMLTALSMASMLGIKGWSQDPAVLLVVDPGAGRLVALDCEDAPRPLGLSIAGIQAARASAIGPVAEVVHDGRLIHLVDVARLLATTTGARDGA
jgi:purine-binding chemotaxis protein CheW